MWMALILVGLGIFLILFALSRESIPWASHLKRVKAGSARKAEWVAPAAVIVQIQSDYLDAIEWLNGAAVGGTSTLARHFLIGRFLARFDAITTFAASTKRPSFTGVLQARHHIQVRQFSDDGSRCLVVDHQTSRSMMSYHPFQPFWSLRQSLDDGTVVFQMCYDVVAKRWKIESFVQELPPGWGDRADVGHLQFGPRISDRIGRDS